MVGISTAKCGLYTYIYIHNYIYKPSNITVEHQLIQNLFQYIPFNIPTMVYIFHKWGYPRVLIHFRLGFSMK